MYDTEAIISSLQKVTEGRTSSQDLSAKILLKVDKASTCLQIKDGSVQRIEADGESDIRIAISSQQFSEYLEGSYHFSESFIKGDFKPEGSTGALVSFLEILEDENVRQSLVESLA